MARRFMDKVVIVTGSSGGIGRAAAQLFAEEGAKITITGRKAESLYASRDLLLKSGAQPEGILEVIGDIREESVQKQLVDETVAKFGKIDILVNNAGASGPDDEKMPGFQSSMESFDYVIDLNTRSVLSLTKLALPHLVKSQGEIVNISSVTGLPRAYDMVPYYAMAKAALDQLTRALAVAYIKLGVRVNGVSPGPVMTDFLSGASEEVRQKMIENIAKCTPIGRFGRPREIAEAIAYLCDRRVSEFIVGQSLVIDGGRSIVIGGWTKQD